MESTIKQEKKEMNKLERIGKIFTKPKLAFESIRENPDSIMVLGIFTLIGVICFIFTKDYYKLATMDSLINGTQVEGLEINDAMINAVTASAIIFGVLSVFVAPLLKGLLTHWISLLFGGDGTLKQTISVTVYSYCISVFGFIVKSVLMIITDNYLITFSPAAFLDASNTSQMGLYYILSTFEVFNIWYLIVAGIGYSIVQKISLKKAMLITFIPTILILAIQLTSL
ncbi:MAG: YIP1 family protein [Tissierellales bacterium]|jgi:hypothetical protein|nr:YIP1 family protein [Tissierellales bacterium]